MTRLLIDENLPPALAAMLCLAGHDAVHVNQVGLSHTEDQTIMIRAQQEARTVVTLDRDYPHLLRQGAADGPSVIRISQRGSQAVAGVIHQAEALQSALPKLEAYLTDGASVTLDARGVRVDPLPLGRPERSLDGAGPVGRHLAGSGTTARDGRDPSRTDGRDPSRTDGRDPSRTDGRDPSRTDGRDPSRTGRDAADQPRGHPGLDGIGRQRERRAHPSSPELGR